MLQIILVKAVQMRNYLKRKIDEDKITHACRSVMMTKRSSSETECCALLILRNSTHKIANQIHTNSPSDLFCLISNKN